ncbi:MAG: archaeosortase A [Thermoplasmatota archaeon]
MNGSQEKSNAFVVFLFFFIPTIMLILGYFATPFPHSEFVQQILLIPLFAGLILLGTGFFIPNKTYGSIVKIMGWVLFSLFWATQPSTLYIKEGGDVFNAAVCIIGIYILIYMAYHEWLSIKTKNFPSCLNWIAGGTFFAGIIYFSIDSSLYPPLKTGLITLVAEHTEYLLQLLGVEVIRQNHIITYNGVPIAIIFACTAIQSMVLFVGMIGALSNIHILRRLAALSITVIPIYFLNLIRNAGVIILVGGDITSFEMAHNVIAKIGSLIALIILLFITFKIIPELYDEILCIFNLTKRKGPVELFITKLLGKTKT